MKKWSISQHYFLIHVVEIKLAVFLKKILNMRSTINFVIISGVILKHRAFNGEIF